MNSCFGNPLRFLLVGSWALVGSALAAAPQQPATPVAQPVLEVRPSYAATEEPWFLGEPLVLRVALHPPAGETFVLDPVGGFAAAVDLVVTDAAGVTQAWPFTRQGGESGGPLRLPRTAHASLEFTFDPAKAGVRPVPGPYTVLARLQATTGSWRGSVSSRPLRVEAVELPAPQLSLALAEGDALLRGWPTLVAVRLQAAPDAAVWLPRPPAAVASAVQLTLLDANGRPTAIDAVCLPSGAAGADRLAPGAAWSVTFRVPAAATAGLAPGNYTWTATYTVSASKPSRAWVGSVRAEPVAFAVQAAPEPLSPALARRRTLVDARDALAAATVQLAVVNRPSAPLALRETAARQLAGPLVAAEKGLQALLAADAKDSEALAASIDVHALADEPAAARACMTRLLAARKGEDLGAFAALRARCASRIAQEETVTAALRAALVAVRAGQAPEAVMPATPTPAPTSAPATPAGPVVTVAGTVSTGAPGELDAKFLADADGQWASGATASSQYSTDAYAASRATGAPNVANHADDANAWAPGVADREREQLSLTFAAATTATAVRVRQSFHPGTITKVELVGSGNERAVVFAGADPNQYAASQVGWFVVEFAAVGFPVVGVVLTLDTMKVPGWNEIDAVQLVGRRAAR